MLSRLFGIVLIVAFAAAEAPILADVAPHDFESANEVQAAEGGSIISRLASSFSKAISNPASVLSASAKQQKESAEDAPPPGETKIASRPISGASAIASLPPAPVVTSLTSHNMPQALLPSKLNVVTHQPVAAETNPRKRGQCSAITSHVEKSGMLKFRNSLAFAAFVRLINLVSEERANQSRIEHVDDDKFAHIALNLIAESHGTSHLPWDYIGSLRNCAVDSKGRTIYMRLVQLGYLKALDAPSSDQLNTINLHELRDTDNNNLLHLAVMSKSLRVVNHAVLKIGADYLLKCLQQQNINGKRPLDLAVDLQLEDITTKLKSQFGLVNALATLDSRMNYQSPDVVQMGKQMQAAPQA